MFNSNIAPQTLSHQQAQLQETRIAKCENDIAGMLEKEGIVPASMSRDAAHFLWQLVYEQQQPQYGIEIDGLKYIYNTYPKLVERYELKFHVETVRKQIIRPLEKTGLLDSCKPRVHFSYHEKGYRVNLEVARNLMAAYYEWYQSHKLSSQRKRDSETKNQYSDSNRMNSTPAPTESGQQTASLNTKNRHDELARESPDDNISKICSEKNCQQETGSTALTELNQESTTSRSTSEVGETANDQQLDPALSTGSEEEHYSAPQMCDETLINGAWKSAEERELFAQDIYAMLKNLASVELNSPEGYTNALLQRLDAPKARWREAPHRGGDSRSLATLEKWRNGEPFEVLFPQFAVAETPSSQSEAVQEEVNRGSAQGQACSGKSAAREGNLQEWQIKAEDTGLLEQGYQVGEIYPQFLQWATGKLKYHPDLTDYAAKAHALKKLTFERQLAFELWKEFKRLIVREMEDKQEQQKKGQPYYVPNWMKLPPDTPVKKAREASLELSQAQWDEQQRLEATRAQIEGEKEQLSSSLPGSSSDSEEAASEGQSSFSFGQWYDLAKAQGLVEASVEASVGKQQGIRILLKDSQQWVWWEDLLQQGYTWEYLQHQQEQAEQAETKDDEASSPGCWVETIRRLVEQVKETVYESWAVSAINNALTEVSEIERETILALARNALSPDSLNQIEVGF
ncbi:MAG: hypothetical protein ABEI32_09055 [Halothece sp.]